MATTTFIAPVSNSTDANFRDWGSKTSAALAAVGMVKTADTGQINWSTVLAPTAGTTYQGYEIWRFNDSLQATAPLYLKIEYGSGSVASALNIRWTIGKGSDGAGTISLPILPAQSVVCPTLSATSYTWYLSSGDGSMLCLAPAPALLTGSSSALTWSMVLERSRSTSGAATGTGFHFAYQNGSGTVPCKTYNYAAVAGITAANIWPVAPPSGSDGVAGGGRAPLFPAILTDGAGNWWQPRSVLVGLVNDLGVMNAFDVPGWGTYLPINGMLYYDAAGDASSRAAIAWY